MIVIRPPGQAPGRTIRSLVRLTGAGGRAWQHARGTSREDQIAIKVIVELQAKPGRRDELNEGSRGDGRVRTAARAAGRPVQGHGHQPASLTGLITHAVQDVDRWLAGKAERAAALPGAKDITDLVAMDGSNHAAVAFDIDDLDALTAVLSSVPPEMAAQAESHGVIMPMTAYVQR